MKATCVLMAAALVACPALAQDWSAPDWDRNATTTAQVWEFSENVNPFSPDVDDNPFGTASSGYTGPGVSYLPEAGYPGAIEMRSGVLQASLPGDEIETWIPNSADANLLTEVYIQLVFASNNPDAVAQIATEVTDPDDNWGTRSDAGAQATPIGTTGWYLVTDTWYLAPQPESEIHRLILKDSNYPAEEQWPSSGYFAWLDTLVIHTRSLPFVDWLPGDADGDGDVDTDDYAILAGAFGGSGTWSDGDFDLDGDIDFGDYQVLEGNFGEVGGGTVPTPEPTTMAMIACGALALRRRKA